MNVPDEAVSEALTFARRNLSYKKVALDNGRLVKVAALSEDFIRGVLAAAAPFLADGTGVPEGWKLVPIEPTDEMVDAFSEAGTDARYLARQENVRHDRHHPMAIADAQWVPAAYRAMLAAAPAPKAEG